MLIHKLRKIFTFLIIYIPITLIEPQNAMIEHYEKVRIHLTIIKLYRGKRKKIKEIK